MSCHLPWANSLVVAVCGATGAQEFNFFAREDGIVEEILLENLHRNPSGNRYIWDSVLLDFIYAEENIDMYLNTTVCEAECEEDEIKSENFNLFRTMMRHCYLNKHLELLAWADEVASLSRERQMGLMTDFARLLREAYITHAGVKEASYLWGEEAEFCSKFSPYIGSENIEPILELLEEAMRRLRQNGDPRIVFSYFALATSRYINFGK